MKLTFTVITSKNKFDNLDFYYSGFVKLCYYAVFHYITAQSPLAHCTHIYNSMNYESASFHHSWNVLPDVQITLREITADQEELLYRIPITVFCTEPTDYRN